MRLAENERLNENVRLDIGATKKKSALESFAQFPYKRHESNLISDW